MELIAEKGRFESSGGQRKTYKWRRPGEDWTGLEGLPISQLPLYNAEVLSAADPGDPIYFVEGEKCADAIAKQWGAFATTTGGGAGQKDFGTCLQMLAGHDVILWPDNDEQGAKYMNRVAAELGESARTVLMVDSSGLPPKGDVVDYMEAGGLADDVQTTPVTTTATCQQHRDGYLVAIPFAEGQAMFNFQGLRMMRREIHAEVEVWLGGVPGLPKEHYWGRLNLGSTSNRQVYCRELKGSLGDRGWPQLLMQAIMMARAMYLEEDTAMPFEDIPPSRDEYLLSPFLPKDRPTMIFGDGGSGKSFLALKMALCVATGAGFMEGFDTPLGPEKVLYVDWEADAATLKRRMDRVVAGAGVSWPKGMFYYWEAEGRALHDQIDAIERRIKKEGITFVIIDSAAAALGGPATDDDLVGAFFNSLARLGCTSLIIAHITKDQKDKTKPFGSTMWHNRARCTWFVTSSLESDDTELGVGMVHRKQNDGKLLRHPIGVNVTFEDPTGPIRIGAGPAAEWLDEHQPLATRIEQGLARKGFMTIQALAEELGKGEPTIRATLSRMKKKGVVRDSGGGKWTLNKDPDSSSGSTPGSTGPSPSSAQTG
jgi:KaiC/GvpD/RAD55 family RecA-like ATPase